MNKRPLDRREFLQLVVSGPVSIPILFVVGCDSIKTRRTVKAPELSPEASLRKLILVLGPWHETERDEAEDFARRFLKAEHAVSSYLPDLNRLVQSLARRFPEDTLSVNEIDLGSLPADERKLLLDLSMQLYSFVEIRFHVAQEPPWGECQADRARYTLAPSLLAQ